jgi:beta-lactamase superfamily II metal-dependent hydrolase
MSLVVVGNVILIPKAVYIIYVLTKERVYMVKGYILNVGCGNMVAILFPNGKTMVVDCNLFKDNSDAIIAFLKNKGVNKIDVFLNTHRDSDHLRGIKELNAKIPITEIWDNEVSGSTDADEYQDYMILRRNKINATKRPFTYNDKFCNNVVLQYINANYDDVNYDINDTSIVIKIDYIGSSILLAGDTSFKPWKEKILSAYSQDGLKSNLLLASHHGSITFFDDPSDEKNYYVKHIKSINPEMTIISVGDNNYGLPDKKAIELYTKYSTGSGSGQKVWRTDEHGNIYFELRGDGHWFLTPNA